MFQFDLEAVLNYRVRIEEQCQLALAEAAKRLQYAMDVLEGLQKEKNDLIRHLVKMQEKALTSDVIAAALHLHRISEIQRRKAGSYYHKHERGSEF